jgi:hypothetical protein
MREEEKMKRLTDSPFVVDTSWKVLFGCATVLLILIEGSGIYDLLFKSPHRMKTVQDMVYVLMPWIASLLGLRSLSKITGLKNLKTSTFWMPRFCIAFLVCFTYILLIEGVGTLADWLK